MKRQRVDLHTHTCMSDGELTPSQLVREAKKLGLTHVAITDHDTMLGVEEGIRAGNTYGVTVIPGVEFDAKIGYGQMHLLVYFPDPRNSRFQMLLYRQSQSRRERNEKYIALFQKEGIDITMEKLAASTTTNMLGKPHFASYLFKKGYLQTEKEIFQKYFKSAVFKAVDRDNAYPEEICEIASQANGIVVLAHPQLLKISEVAELQDFISRRLIPYGLDVIEIRHSSQTQKQQQEYEALAQKLGLIATVGSDFHGKYKPEVKLGTGKNNNISINKDIMGPFMDLLKEKQRV